MAANITPRFVELTYEAALKSFWRKEALRKFLRGSHVTDAHIATWAGEESKRDFLDRTFQKLQANDRGKAVIFEMARALSEQTTFPDLRNWEDSDEKIVRASAPRRALGGDHALIKRCSRVRLAHRVDRNRCFVKADSIKQGDRP